MSATLLAGPLLRRVQARHLALWLATESPGEPWRVRITLHGPQGRPLPAAMQVRTLRAGARLHLHLVEVRPEADLPEGVWTGYRVWLAPPAHDTAGDPAGEDHDAWADATEAALCYPGRETPGFVYAPRVRAVLHGSCRKPHHGGADGESDPGDGLARADAHLQRLLAAATLSAEGEGGGAARGDAEPWPSALVLTGDQVYCDDVAGPMLRAIHALGERLGLPDERLACAGAPDLPDAAALRAHPHSYCERMALLPRTAGSRAVVDLVFGGVRKPVFTSDHAQNHLITLAEVLAMLLLVWSPRPWAGLDMQPPPTLAPRHHRRWAHEQRALDGFVRALPAVRRVLAHLPVAMVFDDHDISDDWNLSREWEQAAYGHPFSRRVIGNALIGYLLGQAWGNAPEAFDAALLDRVQAVLDAPGAPGHDALIEELLHQRHWDYRWDTTPPLIVLDSRTRRWRSEVSPRRPSGLLDWEGLTDLQQALRGLPAVLLVASAPVFGVKLIETLQRLFTFFGKPLMVDAENWMAHPGAASAILNIFRHPQTPRHFVILSGDVHYSFVYDVALRLRARLGQADPLHAGAEPGPQIWQVCSSGLRNRFPSRLLAVLDHANRWLYSPRSPLNRFTRRRLMRVTPRKPEGTPHGRRLLQGCGIGLLVLDDEGRPVQLRQLMADGRDVAFVPREAEAREE